VARGRPSVIKRQKEAARKERQRNKEARRAERAAEKEQRPGSVPGEDPDLAGIVAGPQPLPWQDDGEFDPLKELDPKDLERGSRVEDDE
jgi:hypothetical protein